MPIDIGDDRLVPPTPSGVPLTKTYIGQPLLSAHIEISAAPRIASAVQAAQIPLYCQYPATQTRCSRRRFRPTRARRNRFWVCFHLRSCPASYRRPRLRKATMRDSRLEASRQWAGPCDEDRATRAAVARRCEHRHALTRGLIELFVIECHRASANATPSGSPNDELPACVLLSLTHLLYSSVMSESLSVVVSYNTGGLTFCHTARDLRVESHSSTPACRCLGTDFYDRERHLREGPERFRPSEDL